MNPYSTGTWMPDLSPQILSLGKMALDRQSHMDELAYREDALRQAAEQNSVENRFKERQVQAQEAAVRNDTSKLPVHRQPFGYGDAAVYQGIAKKLGLSDKSLLSQRVGELVKDSQVDKAAAYQALLNDDSLRQDAAQNIQKNIAAAVEKNPNYLTTDEGKKMYETAQFLTQPENWQTTINSLFSSTVKSMAGEALKAKAVLLRAARADKPGGGYITAGNDIVDVSGDKPVLVYRAPFARQDKAGKLIQVQDAPGKSIWVDRDEAAGQKTPAKPKMESLADLANKITGAGDYKTAEDVRSAYKAGKIDKDQAISILQKSFGYK